MFRHSGKGRTYAHNLKLASILSCVAGIVNSTGVLHLNTLTTNVTGHFAYFAEELFLKRYTAAFSFLLFIFFFLLGAFTSSFLMESVAKQKKHTAYVLPVTIEMMLFMGIGLWAIYSSETLPPIGLASTLLFAMGLQNALVTRISHSVVRTTHLTGLFTDLGIELAQFFFPKSPNSSTTLRASLLLKLSIITGFFIGCLVGGFSYTYTGLPTLLLPAGMLLYALMYDRLRFQYYHWKRENS